MMTPLKLNSIDQEHLQELYDATGIARDELPYTPAFAQVVSEQLWASAEANITQRNMTPEQATEVAIKRIKEIWAMFPME